jgi:glycosyl transferase family 87
MTPSAESPSVRYLRDILLGLLPLLFGIQCMGWITFFPGALRGHADFRQLYAAGYMIWTGHAGELYDYQAQKAVQDALVGADESALPFIRPAYQALLFVPFSLMPYRAAYLAFLAVNVILLGIAFWLLRPRLNNMARAWQGLPIFTFLVFYPVELSLLQGQDSILLLLLLGAALVALDRRRESAAGALVALGLFKLQIVIPITLLFLLWRRLRFCAGFALSACLVAAICVWTTGLAQTSVFFRALLSVGGVAGHQISFPLRVSIMANLRGLVFGLAHSRLSASGILILTVLASAGTLLAAAFAARRQPSENQFILAVTASVVVSYYLFIHDLSVLLIPIILTLDRYFGMEQTTDSLRSITGWTAALLLIAPMCIFLMPGHFYLMALPIFAFMVMLMWSARRELSQVRAVRRSGELDG